jgi:hypothetical protein
MTTFDTGLLGVEHLVAEEEFAPYPIRDSNRLYLVSNKFEDEEVYSNASYVSGYVPQPLHQQIKIICERFPQFECVNQDLLTKIDGEQIPLPKGAEGWFAIPNIWRPQNHSGVTDNSTQVLLPVLNTIKHTRNNKLINHCEVEALGKHLHDIEHSWNHLCLLSKQQNHPEVLIIAAQLGIRHRGKSVRRAQAVFSRDEFGLNSFAVACMLLTHPSRLMSFHDLRIDTSGDKIDFAGYTRCLSFGFDGEGIEFIWRFARHAHEHCGAASGFIF